ncbi:response regulator transcription factor [Rhodococcus chondri]|uniref:Response regulator transcription factor n=1 Tax=Rhodococcus chondri TaxID=3065941 RepID=A0ABU7JYS4_9NOCA|nr:response regulator transcription factor [Rhodococcus sp. CC-R104]MEE2035153.1 response regulator transcription factor [Rhodococcus sp. CC-R104]
MVREELLSRADAALAEGRWGDARSSYEQALADEETGAAYFGSAIALWWLGSNRESVDRCTRAYTLFRRSGAETAAARCAVWLAITYKANFANFAAANGWIARAERMLAGLDPGSLHGWVWVARAYRLPDLDTAEALSSKALDVARSAGDADLELVALSQLGLVLVGKGEAGPGFALIDEAMAAALAGDRSTLDTVVYTCCDMLNACELTDDVERAAQWCRVADDFVRTYGCPFLYAECRILYGSVLAATGRWDDADRELCAGVQLTAHTYPALHTRASTRLAELRIRQGRLEEAGHLLDDLGVGVEARGEQALSLAALLLARGDAHGAGRTLEPQLRPLEQHRTHLTTALDLLVDAYLTVGDLGKSAAAARRLTEIAARTDNDRSTAVAAGAAGRVAAARGHGAAAAADLEAALRAWSRLELPFESARTRVELGRVLADRRPEVAVDHLRRALATFETLGAAREADRAAAVLRSLGVRCRARTGKPGLLTVREKEVLRLIGAGLSNPEIAARLFVSRKTASHHVSSILAKLDLRNRAEAAAYVATVLGPRRGSDLL